MRRDESKFASPAVVLQAKQLGGAVRAARLARNSTQEAMAERARMSALTWLKIERGHVSVALGIWFSALEQTGLLSRLGELGSPQNDPVGEQLRRASSGNGPQSSSARPRKSSTFRRADELGGLRFRVPARQATRPRLQASSRCSKMARSPSAVRLATARGT